MPRKNGTLGCERCDYGNKRPGQVTIAHGQCAVHGAGAGATTDATYHGDIILFLRSLLSLSAWPDNVCVFYCLGHYRALRDDECYKSQGIISFCVPYWLWYYRLSYWTVFTFESNWSCHFFHLNASHSCEISILVWILQKFKYVLGCCMLQGRPPRNRLSYSTRTCLLPSYRGDQQNEKNCRHHQHLSRGCCLKTQVSRTRYDDQANYDQALIKVYPEEFRPVVFDHCSLHIVRYYERLHSTPVIDIRG